MVFPLHKAALHVCLLPPTWAGVQGLGWGRFPCHGHKFSTSSFPLYPLLILSRPHPFSPSCDFSEYLIPVLFLCPHHSLPPVYSSSNFIPPALAPSFSLCCRCQQGPQRCNTGSTCSMLHMLGVTIPIEAGTDLGLKFRWAGFHLEVSQASLPQSHWYPHVCYATTSKGVRISTEALVPWAGIWYCEDTFNLSPHLICFWRAQYFSEGTVSALTRLNIALFVPCVSWAWSRIIYWED